MTGKRPSDPIPKGAPRKPKRPRPLPARSPKREAVRAEEEAIRDAVFRRDGGCVLRQQASHRCIGPDTPHHLAKASAGGPYTAENLVTLCSGSNTAVEDDPEWGRWVGLVIRWDIPPAVAWQRRVDCGLVVRSEQPPEV